MAAVKAKKPTSKLKAGQKKKVNKWLILGGVAAVAIIGVVVVRFSSASQWVSIARPTGFWRVTTKTSTVSNTVFTMRAGRKYRVCFRGYSEGSGSQVWLMHQKRSVSSRSSLVCTSTVGALKDIRTGFAVTKISGPNVIITAISADELR